MSIKSVTRATVVAAIVLCGGTSVAGAEPAEPRGSVWDSLARCESGGNWATNTGNGYYGGLQFSRRTWLAFNGARFASYPHRATREQQIAIATAMRDSQGGYGAWPACARKLGLPR
jgi:hypothetical protein